MDIQNMTYTDKWNLFSMDVIENLQERFQQHEWWLVNSSAFGDTRQAFLFFFPLLSGLLNVVGAKVLWATVLVEWTNLILKWAFKGDRPYWWASMSPLYDTGSHQKLQQFFNTCETGPGTPSGHMTLNVAIIYIIANGIKASLARSNIYPIIAQPLSMLATAISFMWITIVFMSRLYIQSHFLHQCILGVVIGYLLGRFVWFNNWLLKSHLFKSIMFTALLVGTSFGAYYTMLSHGMDPLWSIPLAKKHCVSLDFIKVETQPHFLIVRFTAAALGLGLALSSSGRKYFATNKKSGFTKLIFQAMLNVAVARIFLVLQGLLPTDQLPQYLAGSFFMYFALPYVVIAIIPYQLSKIFS